MRTKSNAVYGVLGAVAVGALTVCAQTKLVDFQLNEGTGVVTTSAVGTLVGNLGSVIDPANTPLGTADSPSGAAGDLAVQFLNSGFLMVDDSASRVLAVADSPLTLETWIKYDGVVREWEGIMGYGGSYKLGLHNGELIFTLYGIVDISSTLVLPVGTWCHVAAVWEPGMGVTFYVDASANFVNEDRAKRPYGNAWFSMGSEGGTTTSVQATLDRVRIHAALLTYDELDNVADTPKAPLASTLVAYGFNETAQPYKNAKAPELPTIVGDIYLNATSKPTWVNDSPTGGSTDYSLEFTGAGVYVRVPDPETAISLDTGDFTAQCWVKFGAQPNARAVLFSNNGPGCAVSFSIENRKVFVTAYGILDIPSAAAIPDDGVWHHVAVVHETGKEMRFYVDGILGDTVAYTGGILIGVRTDNFFWLGCEGGNGLPYVGRMDRFMFTRGIVAANDLDFRPVPGIDPEAPTLNIQTVAEIAWATLPAGYQLQSTTDIADPSSWAPVAGAPMFVSEGTYRFYAPILGVKTFYRLVKP